MPRSIRRPLHAGSWYSDEETTLADEIQQWLDSADVPDGIHARAVIAPHAGYRYCGHVMAYSYKYIDPTQVSRVFLFGPSHHVYTKKCVLSSAKQYETPFGSMEIDQEIYAQLSATGEFEVMNLDVDEAEHSLELHTPYIKKVMGTQPFTLIPIMVGALSTDSEARYGKLLAPYLNDRSNLFVISSDFCHWGSRFSYTFYERSQGDIWKSIQWLDEMGMKIIEKADPQEFAAYLREYKNTICGRHPIGVFLNMLQHCDLKHKVEFKQYDQSSKCMVKSDSSVSYAAAIVTVVD